jgi:hypothetical protein
MTIKYGKKRPIIVVSFLTFIILSLPFPGGAQPLYDAVRLQQQVIQLYQQGRYKEAIPLAERALAITEKALGPAHRRQL